MGTNLHLSSLLAVLAILAFGSGCGELPSGLPEPEGYDGFLALGWQAIQQGQYQEAFDRFEQAIDVDVSRPDGYLGAATACLYLENHWEIADGYFQAAIQQDLGHSAVVRYTDEVLVQDTLWTVFECVDPDLPQDSLDVWLPMIEDSGEVWVGWKIWDYLTRNGLDTDLSFRFQPGPAEVTACVDLYNMQTGASYGGDSVSSGYVYLDVPMVRIYVWGDDMYTWIMANHPVRFDYAILSADQSSGQITRDAMAGWTMLQEIRGADGDFLQAAACASGLLQIDPDYQFGEGSSLRSGVFDIDIVDVAASGASGAFARERFIYSWFLCKQAGFGLDLDPESDNFLLDLLNVIFLMQN